jgi:hypothetical protein
MALANFGKIFENTVVELIVVDLDDVPDWLGSDFVQVPDDVGSGYTRNEDGTFSGVTDEFVPAEERRVGMHCTKMQGILTLGETKWGEVLAYRNQEFVEATNTEPEIPATTWPEKMIIDSAQNWERTSENIAFFGQLLKYDDLQMDALFIAAADVVT